MREENPSGRNVGRRRKRGDEGPDLFAEQLSEVVKHAFAEGGDAEVAGVPPVAIAETGALVVDEPEARCSVPLECIAIPTGPCPAETFKFNTLSTPLVGLIRNDEIVLEVWLTT